MKVAKELNESRTSAVSAAVKHLQAMQKLAGDLENERAAYAEAYRSALKVWSKADLDKMNLPAPAKPGRTMAVAETANAKPLKRNLHQ